MNAIKAGIIGTVIVLASSVMQALAIENLQISVQCSNVVLSWPSVPGDTYLIRCRPDLTTNSTWTVVTNSYPAAPGTNITFFVHSNVVVHPNCGGSGGGSSFAAMSGGGGGLASMATAALQSGIPLVMPSDGLGDAVPLNIYPPGFDLSGLLVFDPSQSSWVSGSTYSLSQFAATGFFPGGLDVGGADGPNGSTNDPPDMAFYEVVKVGVHIFGITNGMVLNGQVPLQVEFANTNTNSLLTAIFLANSDTNFQGNIPGTSFIDPAQATNRLTGTWDTMQITNGTYAIQVGAMLDDNTFVLDHPVTVAISNMVWYPDPWSVGGAAIYIGVQTVFSNGGTFRLDLYDDQQTYIGQLNGYIDANGYLAYPGITGPGFSLGNTDGQGNQYPSTRYDIVYSITPTNASGPPWPLMVTNRVTIEPPWNFQPTFATVCWMEVFPNSAMTAQTDEYNMVQGVANAESAYHALTIGDTLNPYRVLASSHPWTDVRVNGLQLPNSRDFVYFGHGSPQAIGDSTTAGFMTTGYVSLALTNNAGTNAHPYRFVFLDGCQTANGDWPQAFGIPKKESMKIADFVNKRGIRPRAFMGWNQKKPIGWTDTGTFNDNHGIYISTFWTKWVAYDTNTSDTFTLQKSIQAAGIITDINTGNTSPNPARDGMVVYGTDELTVWR